MRLRGFDRAVVGGAVAGVVLVLSGCGGDDGGSGGEEREPASQAAGGSEPEETTTTTTALSPEEQEVLDAYEAANEAVVAAYDPADPEHPDLHATHGGQALFNLMNHLVNYQMEGLSVVATSSENDPEVISVSGDEAIVEDCVSEVLETFDAETREPVRDPEMSVAHSHIHMERRDGTWKVIRAEPAVEGVAEETC